MEIKSKEIKLILIVLIIGILVGGSIMNFFKSSVDITENEYTKNLDKVKVLLDLNYKGIISDIRDSARTDAFYTKFITSALYSKRFNFENEDIYNYYLARYQGYILDYSLEKFSIMSANTLQGLGDEDELYFLGVINLKVSALTSEGEFRYIVPIYGTINAQGYITDFGEL